MAGNPLEKHEHLLREQQKLEEQQRALESDPAYQRARAFKDDMDALMVRHEVSLAEAVAILCPERARDDVKERKGSSERPARTWINPLNGETVSARSLNHKTLRNWIDEHGRETVVGWEQQA